MASPLWRTLVILTSFSFSLRAAESDSSFYRNDSCDTLLFGEIVLVTETVFTITNVEYLKGTVCQQDFTVDNRVQIFLNWSGTTSHYNDSTGAFITGARHIFCCTKDQLNRCHLSTDTPIIRITQVSNESGKNLAGDDHRLTKRQNMAGKLFYTEVSACTISCII